MTPDNPWDKSNALRLLAARPDRNETAYARRTQRTAAGPAPPAPRWQIGSNGAKRSRSPGRRPRCRKSATSVKAAGRPAPPRYRGNPTSERNHSDVTPR
jgi:hypothetical protein